jgi:hypothetical protein
MAQWRDRSEPSYLGLNSQQPVDLSRVARGLNPTRREAERESREGVRIGISYIGNSGVRRLEGVTFDRRSCEVPRAEAHENTWHIHQVGTHVVDRRTHVAWRKESILS